MAEQRDDEWTQRIVRRLRAEVDAGVPARDPAREERELELIELEALRRMSPGAEGRWD